MTHRIKMEVELQTRILNYQSHKITKFKKISLLNRVFVAMDDENRSKLIGFRI